MIRRALLCAALVAATPALASGTPHSYNYVAVSHNEIEIPVDIDGLSDNTIEIEDENIRFSYRGDGGALIQLGYADGEVTRIFGVDPEDVGERVDVTMYSVLIGGARFIDDTTSIWGGIGYTYTEIETRFFGDTDSDRYQFGVGFRHSPMPFLELNASGFLVHEEPRDFDEDETDFELAVGLRLRPIDHFSIGGSYAQWVDNDVEFISVDARFEF